MAIQEIDKISQKNNRYALKAIGKSRRDQYQLINWNYFSQTERNIE